MTKTLEQMNEEVWKEVADKEMEFGCYFIGNLKGLLKYKEPIAPEGHLCRYHYQKCMGGGQGRFYVEGIKEMGISRRLAETNELMYDGNENIIEVIGHPPHIGVVMQWMYSKPIKDYKGVEQKHTGFTFRIQKLSDLRPQDKLSQPLPTPGAEVGEEWRPVLLFLNELSGNK